MGFKCPVCMKDFDRDQVKWKEHLKHNHSGSALDIVESLVNILADETKEIEYKHPENLLQARKVMIKK